MDKEGHVGQFQPELDDNSRQSYYYPVRTSGQARTHWAASDKASGQVKTVLSLPSEDKTGHDGQVQSKLEDKSRQSYHHLVRTSQETLDSFSQSLRTRQDVKGAPD